MALQLLEGQDFGAHYSLLHRIAESDGSENWLALDKELNERVLIKVFKTSLSKESRSTVAARLSSLKGLIHPHIARLYDLDRHQDLDYVSSQYIKGAQPWQPSGSLKDQWPFLIQIFDALEFAHSLSIAHGHLHPGNLLIDDTDNLYITDFGLPANPKDAHEYSDYLSPQIQEHRSPDVSDDVYSLGCLMFLSLTGRSWHAGETFQSDSPIPDEIQRLISRMLHSSAYERPREISSVRKAIEQYVEGDASVPIAVQPAAFGRQSPRDVASASPTAHRLPRERQVMPVSTAVLALAILILLVTGVFFYLPEPEPGAVVTTAPAPVQQPTTPSPAQPTPREPELAPFEIARLERLKDEGKEVANDLVRLQIKLEDLGVQIWAPEEYREVTVQATDGDNLYRDGKYQEAIDVYESAISRLNGLQENMEAVRQENIERGQQALETGEVRTAIEAYTVLGAMEPDNETWDARLERAENLEQVLAHMQQGRAYEQENALTEALEQFRLAARLDPDWRPAGEAVTRINGKIAQERFTDAMSRGFTALASKEYEEARRAFARAQEIYPNSSEPEDGLQQITLAERLDTIQAHREAAARHEQSEQWQEALAEYEAALAMDSTLEFAQRGTERATEILETHRHLDEFLSDPTVLQDDDQLAAARRAVADASRLDNPGPKLKDKISELSKYVSLARVPIPLKVTSDNQTEVTVYKVGRLGKVESKELELYPGKYTIVGERKGYRNVQETVTLFGGQPPQSVYISCTEKI